MVKKCKAKNTFFTAFLSLVILIFTSCFNFFEEPAYNPVLPVFAGYASGNISISDSVSPELAASIKSISPAELSSRFAAPSNRTAFPSIPTGATVTYYAEVTSSSGENWTGSADFSNLPAYSITGLSAGVLWTIEIGIKDGSNKILKDSHTMTTALSVENPVYTHDFELKPFQTTGATPGSGNLVLEIELESGSEITKCKTSLSSTDEYTPSSNKITVSKTGITSGSHTVDFTFYSTDSEVLYQFTESLNVFDNMTTNTWVRNSGTGSSPYLVEETTGGVTTVKCRITNAMVQDYRLRTIYVSSTGSATGTGTFFNPVNSINTAVSKMHDKTIDYTIYVMGTLSSIQEIPATLTDTTPSGPSDTNPRAKSLSISGYNGLESNGEPKDKISLGSGLSALKISTKIPVTIKNLMLTDSGTGLLVEESDANVTLSDGVWISDCDSNTISSSGDITISGSFYCSGSTVIWLSDGKKIKLSGPLTMHSSTDKLKVIPNTYQRGNVIVEADGTNITDISAFKDCFDIDDGMDNEWACYLSADNSKLFVNAPYFVAPASSAPSGYENGNDSTGDGTREYPYESIYRVTSDIHNNNIALDYTIKVAGTITGSQHIVKSGDSVYTDYSADNVINTDNAASITIIGARDLPDDGKPLDGISCGSAMPALYFSATGVPLTLKNIYLTDGCTGLRVSSSAPVYIEEGTEIKENSRANGSYLAKGILMTGGTLYIKGGEIHDNRMSESGYTTMAGGLKLDGVTLYMSGGKIYNNTGYSGGGIANYYGTVYIYGSAIIGDENAESCAGTTNDTRSNFATNFGGGIYNANDYLHTSEIPKVYIGYKPNEEGNPVVDENFTGGIYYNSASRGGGICNNATYDNNSPEVYIAKGTIAFNYASNDGGAIYSSGTNATYKAYAKLYISGGVIKENKVNTANNTALGGAVYATNFYLSGDASIPAGVTDATTHVLATGKQLNDVYIDSGYKITITGKLTPPAGSGGITATITPVAYTDGSEVVALSTSPAPDPATTITETSACFAVTPQVVGAVTTNWNVIEGKLSYPPVSSLSEAPASGGATISSMDEIKTVAAWVQAGHDLAGVTLLLTDNLTIQPEDSVANNYQIGIAGKPFKGTFDGNGKTITYNGSEESPVAYSIFGCTESAVIKNINLEGNVSGTTATSLINTCRGTEVLNCKSSCNVTHNLSSAGGLINEAYSIASNGNYGNPVIPTRNCAIKDCVFSGTVTSSGTYVGGLIGSLHVVNIINCEMTGSVTGSSVVGGFFGSSSYNANDDTKGSIIENSCVTGTITATSGSAGGFAGIYVYDSPTYFLNCCYEGTVTATNAAAYLGAQDFTATFEKCYGIRDDSIGVAWPTDTYGRTGQSTWKSSTVTDANKQTIINNLNAKSITTNAVYAHTDDYLEWERDGDGKPRLVRP